MSKSRYQLQKKRRAARNAAEMEKDTIYYLDFVPLDGKPKTHSTALDDLWCVRLWGDHKRNPQIIEDAVRIFEQNHKVDSWRQVACTYKVNGLWYP